MSKYVKKKNAKKNSAPLKIILLVVLLLLLVAAIWAITTLGEEEIPYLDEYGESTRQPEVTEATLPPLDVQVETNEPVSLGSGLDIERIANYAGVYMEDGTDETVSSVMMIIVRNNSVQDLQLARISIVYEDATAQFEVTNLPAGEAAVLLEKNRLSMPEGEYQSLSASNVVFFAEPMGLMADTFEIVGGSGYLEVKNISDADISGDVFVYYKNSSVDLLYGGITYMARLSGGIKAGETYRLMTGHYSENNSRILWVTCGG